MSSNREQFWENTSYAVVGNSAARNFPLISYGELKGQGRTVFAVDPTTDLIGGDTAFPDFASLPQDVDAVILEVPKNETRDWVKKASDAGIKNLWIHMGCETSEALELAGESNMNVCHGTCAVMYLKQRPSYHSIHKWIMKLSRKY